MEVHGLAAHCTHPSLAVLLRLADAGNAHEIGSLHEEDYNLKAQRVMELQGLRALQSGLLALDIYSFPLTHAMTMQQLSESVARTLRLLLFCIA